MVSAINVNVKGHWGDFTSQQYREYQRIYQKQRYVSNSRKDNKHEYYLENKQTIRGKVVYRRAADVFRHILL